MAPAIRSNPMDSECLKKHQWGAGQSEVDSQSSMSIMSSIMSPLPCGSVWSMVVSHHLTLHSLAPLAQCAARRRSALAWAPPLSQGFLQNLDMGPQETPRDPRNTRDPPQRTGPVRATCDSRATYDDVRMRATRSKLISNCERHFPDSLHTPLTADLRPLVLAVLAPTPQFWGRSSE